MSGRPWTLAQLQAFLAVCRQSTTLTEASAAFSQKYGRAMPMSGMVALFSRHGLVSPRSVLREPDPIQAVEQRQRTDQLRSQHRELVARLQEAEARQKVLDNLDRLPEVPHIERRESSGREGTAVILASDWHIEEYVPRRADTAGNYYDLEVADRRVHRFFDGIAWMLDHLRPVFGLRDVVLWLGGDLMNGYLRQEMIAENELSPVEAIMWLQARVVAGVNFLLEHGQMERLCIVCSHGNHGRTTEKRQIATGAKNSYEWLLYQWLADHYKGESRVQFVTDQSNHQYLRVYDFDLHFHHGDEVRYQGGIGGIAVPLLKAVAGWDAVRRCHYHHIGHWHQLRDFGNATVNGSVVGYNAYAMSVRATPEPPQQAFYVLDSKRGKTAQYPIWVGGDEK